MRDLVVRFTTITLEQEQIHRDVHEEKRTEKEPTEAHDDFLADGRTPERDELIHTELPCGMINLQLNSVPLLAGRLRSTLSRAQCADPKGSVGKASLSRRDSFEAGDGIIGWMQLVLMEPRFLLCDSRKDLEKNQSSCWRQGLNCGWGFVRRILFPILLLNVRKAYVTYELLHVASDFRRTSQNKRW